MTGKFNGDNKIMTVTVMATFWGAIFIAFLSGFLLFLPDDALSRSEKHKEFHENHQFTKLSNYINQRAGR